MFNNLHISDMINHIRDFCVDKAEAVYPANILPEAMMRINEELTILSDDKNTLDTIYAYFEICKELRNDSMRCLCFPRGSITSSILINLISIFAVPDVISCEIPAISAFHNISIKALELNVSDKFWNVVDFQAIFPKMNIAKLWNYEERDGLKIKVQNTVAISDMDFELPDGVDPLSDAYYASTANIPQECIIIKAYHLVWLDDLRRFAPCNEFINTLIGKEYLFDYNDLIGSRVLDNDPKTIRLLDMYKPKCIENLIALESCIHATSHEGYEFEDMYSDSVHTREDIYLMALNAGFTRDRAFEIADTLGRKFNKGIDALTYSIPDNIVEAAKPYRYMFPMSHIVLYSSLYALIANYYRKQCDERSQGGFIGTGLQ